MDKANQIMFHDLTWKAIVIPGTNSGIGKSASIQLAKLGATVVMACLSRKRGVQTIEMCESVSRL